MNAKKINRKMIVKVSAMLLLAISFLGSNSCDNDDNGSDVAFQRLQIVDAELPDSFDLGELYEIRATYVRPDGCTYFQGFDVYPKDTTVREVVAVGATYIDQQCTQEATEVTDRFLFRVVYDQPYTFRFYQGEDANGDPDFLEVEVPVN